MSSGRRKLIPSDSLLQLRQRLDRLSRKNPERTAQTQASAELVRRLRQHRVSGAEGLP